MKIAVTYENGQIFQHFGHTAQFKIYEIEEAMVFNEKIEGGKIVSSSIVDTNGSGHGALAGFLSEKGVKFLICGGIGGGALEALKNCGITVFGGCSGSVDDAVEKLMAGKLEYNPNVHCDHHDHEHGDGGHTCGEHGCGTHENGSSEKLSGMKFSKK